MNSPSVSELFDTESLSRMLAACGFVLTRDGHGPGARPESQVPASPDGFVTALADLGVIQVQGDDRISFLQGQLTNDIETLPVGQAQWSALCSAKGRLLATFLAVKDDQSVSLIISRELAGAITKRLSMYVLRAKVTVTDLTAQSLILGVVGPGAASALETASLSLPEPMRLSDAGVRVVALAGVSVQERIWPRALVVASADRIGALWPQLHQSLAAQPDAWWRATEVLGGTARITPAVQETFVPQMVNFELIGGVDFEKGCYTGQEVVARSQYLGKMKRRMFLGALKADPSQAAALAMPGAPVNGPDDTQIGTVVSSAPGVGLGLPDAWIVLFESRVDGADEATVDGQVLSVLPLPYEIPEPTPFERPR